MSVEKVLDGVTAPEFSAADEIESPSTDPNIGYDEKMTRKLVRKLDSHILPVLVILYLLSFLDRTNIGNARLANLEEDLNMGGLDYNVSGSASMALNASHS